jgi:hypothetical protein
MRAGVFSGLVFYIDARVDEEDRAEVIQLLHGIRSITLADYVLLETATGYIMNKLCSVCPSILCVYLLGCLMCNYCLQNNVETDAGILLSIPQSVRDQQVNECVLFRIRRSRQLLLVAVVRCLKRAL